LYKSCKYIIHTFLPERKIRLETAFGAKKNRARLFSARARLKARACYLVDEFVEEVVAALVSVMLDGALVSGAFVESAGTGAALVADVADEFVSVVAAGAAFVSVVAAFVSVELAGGFEASALVVSALLLQPARAKGRARVTATIRGYFCKKLFMEDI
jgi:hypothetical protein